TKNNARATADALDALGRTEEARRCGSGMGSRVLTTLSPHEFLAGRVLCSQKSNKNAGFNTFSKSGVGHLFWKSHPALSSACFTRSWGSGWLRRSSWGLMSHARAGRDCRRTFVSGAPEQFADRHKL